MTLFHLKKQLVHTTFKNVNAYIFLYVKKKLIILDFSAVSDIAV